ncbi:PREDICTED: LOB domain-containing protein 19-like [Nicotiana attenuata]|uniref:Lob domain-containing protein 19 n=1 Tax=Nicotiana attenuata TaxID=49451 RepID=A0A1J6KMH0_NICAT|nr:PREDICTED: LOB domain-containing protein 19-like [Nicotiana attenuata]OIT24019.1 lob domain-containing protein 19 [Nicotiana attenuata]
MNGGCGSADRQYNNDNNNNNNVVGAGGGGPCGACKFLRRKCVRGCIFAPYFDSDQGTAHFAAVHKVFGASNASKLLLRIPAHKRLDAVVTLCYEALARVRDPIYGCVAHIFTLQQQVVSLQAELAYVQARLSTLQHLPMRQGPQPQSPITPTGLQSSSDIFCTTSSISSSSNNMEYPQFDITAGLSDSFDDQELENFELHTLAREFVSRHLPGVRFRPSP